MTVNMTVVAPLPRARVQSATTACHGRRGNSPSPAPDHRQPAWLVVALPQDRGPARSDRPYVGPGGSAAPFRVALPSALGATDDATSSFGASLRHFEDEADRFRQSLPARGFRLE